MGRLAVASLFLLPFGSVPLAAADPKVLVLSDVHFNPLAGQSSAERLTATDPKDWQAILSESGAQTLSKSGEDTNWALLQSVLGRAGSLADKPKFVLITGDLFAHHLREEYDSKVTRSRDFASFAQKTTFFLERKFKAAFPGVPILLSLGNNDGDCENADYSIQPGGLFLEKILAAIADGARVSPAELGESWTKFGSYDIAHPALRNSRIIVLNTTFLSWRYQNSCGEKGDDPGQRMLEWLEQRLVSAKAHHQKVWLVYHIPPGIDGFASTHPRAPNPDRIVSMWNLRYQTAFEKILAEYSSTVQNQFAGHTHFDEFRLLGTPGAYSSVVFVTPGVSPNVHQNPAFQEASFRSDGSLTGLETWYLPLSESKPEWRQGYEFRREWKLKAVDLPNLSNLYSRLRESSKLRTEWADVYSVWSPDKKPITKRDFAAAFCAAGNARPEDFRKCFCDESPEAAFCRESVPAASRTANAQLRRH